MVLRALVACLLGVGLLCRVSHGAHLRTRRHFARRQICKFEIYRQGKTLNYLASDNNVIFQSHDVLVVQEGSQRLMVFAHKGGMDGKSKDPYCHEQAEIACGALSAQPKSRALLQRSESDEAGAACDSLHVCHPETNPDLSYLRSMIGGAIVERRDKIHRVASIGLGAGTIPLFWSRVQPNTTVEAIDISADVISAAPCFGVQQSPKLKLVHEDGRKYIESQKDGSYDVIFMDAFDNLDQIPPCLKTVEFFKMMSKKLAPGGVLSMNVWPRELGALYSAFATAFPGRVQIGQSPGLLNNVLLGRASGGHMITQVDDDSDLTSPEALGKAEARAWAITAEFEKGRHRKEFDSILRDADICPQYAKGR